MPYTNEQIDNINLGGLAIPNQTYESVDGVFFIGTSDKRLRRKSFASEVVVYPAIGNTIDVQTALQNINTSLVNKTKQVIIDFGDALNQEQRIFNILDSESVVGKKVVASLAYEVPSGKDLDEIEMDEIIFNCKANNGSIDILATSLYGAVANQFLVNYNINY